jgi:hypothetical protein
VAGLSLVSQRLYLLAFGVRLLPTLLMRGYLPVDDSGTTLFRLQECANLALVVLLERHFRRFRASHEGALEPGWCYWLAALGLALAGVLNPGMNNYWLADVAWCLSQVVEVGAMVPQLVVFMRRGKAVDPATSCYVVSQGLARLVQLIFWLDTY